MFFILEIDSKVAPSFYLFLTCLQFFGVFSPPCRHCMHLTMFFGGYCFLFFLPSNLSVSFLSIFLSHIYPPTLKSVPIVGLSQSFPQTYNLFKWFFRQNCHLRRHKNAQTSFSVSPNGDFLSSHSSSKVADHFRIYCKIL